MYFDANRNCAAQCDARWDAMRQDTIRCTALRCEESNAMRCHKVDTIRGAAMPYSVKLSVAGNGNDDGDGNSDGDTHGHIVMFIHEKSDMVGDARNPMRRQCRR